MSEEKFDQWGIVEIMGHDRIAGRITEQAMGGCAFVRVDVPEIGGRPAYTKLFGSSAIFSISLTSEETARLAAAKFSPAPMSSWDARALLESGRQRKVIETTPPYLPEDDEEDDDDDEGGYPP
jgi:hypothetical protein